MGKTLTKTVLVAVVVAAALAGCTKPKDGATGPTGTTGATGPALSGTLQGYVDLFDAYGDLMASDTGVHITSTTLASVNTSTATNGMFQIANLTTGTYELDFAKAGCGSTKIPSLNFTGGGTQYITGHIQLTQVPTYSLVTSGLSVGTTTLTNGGNPGPALSLTVTTAAADVKNRKAIVFYNTSPTVSSTPGNYVGFTVVTIPCLASGSTTGTATIPVSTSLYEQGIASGSTLYLIAYPIAYNSNASSYPDVASGKTIFNNIFTGGATTTATVTVQ